MTGDRDKGTPSWQEWTELFEGACERTSAVGIPLRTGNVHPRFYRALGRPFASTPSTDALADIADALHAALPSYFDKAAFDELHDAFAASDGTFHHSPYASPTTRDYPDDNAFYYSIEAYADPSMLWGAKRIRSRVPLAVVPPPGTPVASPLVAAYFDAVSRLLRAMTHILMPASSATPMPAPCHGGSSGICWADITEISEPGGRLWTMDYPIRVESTDYPSFASWWAAHVAGTDSNGTTWQPATPSRLPRLFDGLGCSESYSVGLCQSVRYKVRYNGRLDTLGYSNPDFKIHYGLASQPHRGAVAVAHVAGTVLIHACKTGISWANAGWNGLPAIEYSESFGYECDNSKKLHEYHFDGHGTGYSMGWNVAAAIPAGGGRAALAVAGDQTLTPGAVGTAAGWLHTVTPKNPAIGSEFSRDEACYSCTVAYKEIGFTVDAVVFVPFFRTFNEGDA